MYLFLIDLVKDNNYSLYKIISIFFISFFSNTFSAISGGGAGLIQLPALILFGIPYSQSLATHKFATVALGFGSSIRNYKSFEKDRGILWQILIFGTPGVILGTSIVNFISEEYLYLILGIFSIFLALYSYSRSNFGLFESPKNLSFLLKIRFAILIFLVAIINGSISSGSGLLVSILLIKTFGIDFKRALSLTFFTVGIFWNAIGAVFLSKIDSVPLNLLILLTLGSFIGGFFGAHLTKLKGNKLIKNTFTLVCLFIGISLLFKSFIIFL